MSENTHEMEELIFELHSSVLKIARNMFKKIRAHFHDAGVPFSQYRLLKKIDQHGKSCLSDLSSHSHMKKGNISRSINKLVKNNLVVRERDPNDRRKVYLTLTKKGKKKLETIRDIEKSFVRDLYASIPSDRIGDYITMINEFSTYMEAD